MRRLLWALSLAVLIIAVISAAAVVWRAELTEAAARNWLARNGFPEASLTVRSAGREQIVATDIDLGPDAPEISRLVADYDLFELYGGRLRAVEVTGLRAVVDPAAERPAPWLDHFLRESDEPAAPAQLPRLTMHDARIEVLGGPEPLAVDFNGEIVPESGDAMASFEGRADATHTQLTFHVEVEGLLSDPDLRLDASGESDLAALPWPADRAPRPAAGTGRFTASYRGPLPALEQPFGMDDEAEAELSLEVAEAALPPYAEDVAGTLPLRAVLRGPELELHLLEPAHLQAARLDEAAFLGQLADAQTAALAARVRQIQIATLTPAQPLVTLRREADGWHWDGEGELRLELTEGSALLRASARAEHAPDFALRRLTADDLRLEARTLARAPHRLERITFDGRADATPAELTAAGELSLRMAQLRVADEDLRDVTFEGPVALSHAAGGETALRLTGPGDLRLAELPDTPPVRIELPPRIDIPEARLTLRNEDFEGEVTFDPGRLAATLERGDDPDIPVRAAPGPVALSFSARETLSARMTLRDAAVELPDHDLDASEVALEMTYDEAADRLTGQLAFGHLRHLDPAPEFAPLRGEAMARLDGEHLLLDGRFGPRANDVDIPVQAEHAVEQGTGLLRFGPAELDLRPDALQPADLSPALEPVETAEGQVALQGGLDWGPDGVTSRGRLRIDGLTAELAGARVEQLSGTIDFDSLSPLRTAPEQAVSAESATAIVVVHEPQLIFQLDVDPTTELPIVRITQAQGQFAGGQLSVSNETYYPGAEVNTVNLDIARISLADLLAMLNVEAVSGQGVLSGRVPVRFGEDGVVIDGGNLNSERSGVLHVALGDYGQALAQQGEEVTMMLNALDDFRYDYLDLTLDRAADGEVAIGVEMEGHNPEVYEGYPFRFNINLTGDMDPILAAMQAGQRLSTDLLQRALEAE